MGAADDGAAGVDAAGNAMGMSEVAKGKRKRENTPEQVEHIQKVKSVNCVTRPLRTFY
jgi:hypothetical protein